MHRPLVSTSSLVIQAPSPAVWHTLIDLETASQYFFGAQIETNWQVGSKILFHGEYNGNRYQEKGIILDFEPNRRIQYSHWSNFDGTPDLPEHYRTWTFDLNMDKSGDTILTVTEDNIPTSQQKERSDQFWKGILQHIKSISEGKQ